MYLLLYISCIYGNVGLNIYLYEKQNNKVCNFLCILKYIFVVIRNYIIVHFEICFMQND